MFTGIIKEILKPVKFVRNSDSVLVTFKIPEGWNLEEGESINIDGVCSTVTEIGETFTVFYMAETLAKTTLNSLDKTHQFNLERSLTLESLVGGHLVAGHIDTTAEVKSVETEGESEILTFNLDKEFIKYLIYKGSVAINGVSLTVTTVNDESFSVSLIPHTLQKTNLNDLKVGESVNIEVDLIAKYIEKLVKIEK
jgi:riboflavin synthase